MTNPAGYYNLYDPQKKYFEVMALAGFVEQSREDNDLQAILRGIIKGAIDAFLKNDSIVTGGQLGRGVGAHVYTLTEAKFYHDGIVHTVPAATLTLAGSGAETIGVKVIETIVGPEDDVTLLDPASGEDNFGLPGAYRRKIECVWVANDATAITLFTFLNDQEQTQPTVGDIDLVTRAMADRTYATSGNFVVTGFDLRAENRDSNTLSLVVGTRNASQDVSGSQAYVQGNKIVKIVPEKLVLDKALDARAVVGQRFFYDGSTDQFIFPSRPAFQVDQVEAIFDVVRTVTNHNLNGYDEVIQPGETLVEILAAYHSGTPGAQVTPYAKAASQAGTGDFYKSDNGLRWDVAGSGTDPISAGDSYQVYCLVSRVVTTGFSIATVNGKTAFDLSAMNPKPYHTNLVDSSTQLSEITVDYQFYLSRVDTVYLDGDGTLGVVKGAPEVKPVAKSAPGGALALGQILLTAGGDAATAVVTAYPTKRKTVEEIQKLFTRLERAEYNLAVKDLDAAGQARAGNAITSLRGVLTEAFSYTASDIVTDGVDGVSRVKFVRAATSPNMLNLENRELTLPQREAPWPLVPTAAGHTAAYCPQAILAPYAAGGYVRAQLAATDTRIVNEFGDGTTKSFQTIQLFPNGDTSLETAAITLNTLDPANAIAMVNSYNPDKRTFSVNPQAGPNLAGFFESASPYLADQWIFIKGSGFTPGAILDVRMDNLAPRAYTLLASATAIAAQAGPPEFPAIPARTLDAGVTRVSPAVTFVGGTIDGTTHQAPGTAYPVVNSAGEFDFWIRTPLDADGRPLRSGAKNITVHSSAGDHASQVFQANATRQIAISTVDASSQVVQAIASLIPPTPPRLASVSVKAGTGSTGSGIVVGNPVTNLPTGSNVFLKFRITWDVALGGMPASFLINLSNGQTASVVPTDTDRANKYVDYTFPDATTAAVEYTVYGVNTGGASIPVTDTITYNSLPPNLNPPTLTSFTANVSGTLVSWGTTITVSWAGLGANATSVLIRSWTNGSAMNTVTPVVGATGSANITVYPGNNVIRMTGIGPAGVVEKEITIAVSQPRDPVAQTFSVDKDGFIDGVGIYLSQIPAADADVELTNLTLEVRNVLAGQPGGPEACVLNAVKTLKRSATAASADATVETYFKFDTPPYLVAGKQYALVVTTDSADYKLYYAKVGNTQIVPTGDPAGTALTRQAYGDGVMFTSSNSSSWNAVQDADMKFRVRAATFTTGETVVSFDPVLGTNMVGLYLSTDLLLPRGIQADGTPSTQVAFEYQLDGAGTWYAIEPDTYEYFTAVAATQVNVRARIKTSDALLSPAIIRGADLKVMRIYRDLVGQYVSKTATYAQAYQTVRMIAKMNLPTGCNVRWFVSDNTAQGSAPANWNSGTAYVVGNVVTYAVDGTVWVSIQDGTNHTPGAGSAYWAPARVDEGVLWRELPAAGQTVTPTQDADFSEYERVIDLGDDGSRTEFRFYLEPSVNSTANSINTPRLRDLITIANA